MQKVLNFFYIRSLIYLSFINKRAMSRRAFDNKFPEFDKSFSVLDQTNAKLNPNIEKKLHEFLPKILERFEKGIPDHVDRHDITIYTGITGIAMMYIHVAQTLNQPKYYEKALPLVEKALKKSTNEYSFLLGDAGIVAVAALLYKKFGKETEIQFLVKKLEEMAANVIPMESKMPDEILYGRAGYLYALLFIEEKVAPGSINPEIVEGVISTMLQVGQINSKKKNSPSPLLFKWHSYYLGAAHGIGGILYMLLQANKFLSHRDLNTYVRPSIDFVIKAKFSSDNYPAVIGPEGDDDELVHWCHGAPGMIHLFCLAYEVFKHPKYLDEARRCAEVIWKRGLLRKGYGLCHGVAGNAYGFLKLFQVTNEERYLYMAVKFMEWCYDYGKHGCRIPDTPLSLFEGMAGTIYFMVDMLQPYQAAFPAFQLSTYK